MGNSEGCWSCLGQQCPPERVTHKQNRLGCLGWQEGSLPCSLKFWNEMIQFFLSAFQISRRRVRNCGLGYLVDVRVFIFCQETWLFRKSPAGLPELLGESLGWNQLPTGTWPWQLSFVFSQIFWSFFSGCGFQWSDGIAKRMQNLLTTGGCRPLFNQTISWRTKSLTEYFRVRSILSVMHGLPNQHWSSNETTPEILINKW